MTSDVHARLLAAFPWFDDYRWAWAYDADSVRLDKDQWRKAMIKQIVRIIGVIVFACAPTCVFAADPPGLITVPSNNSVADTISALRGRRESVGLDGVHSIGSRSRGREV